MTNPKCLTKPQIAAYWRAATSAAREAGVPVDEYRKRVMREECGVTSVKQLNRTHDFDAVMRRFAEDVGDYAMASKFAVADIHRMSVLIRICCEQVLQLKGCPAGSTAARDYLAGVIGQSHIQCATDPRDPSYWLDISPESLRSVFVMLDTHRRRLLRRLSVVPDAFLGFDPSLTYRPNGTGVLLVKSPGQYDSAGYIQVKVR